MCMHMHVRACVRVCVCECVCASAHACVRACVRACVWRSPSCSVASAVKGGLLGVVGYLYWCMRISVGWQWPMRSLTGGHMGL